MMNSHSYLIYTALSNAHQTNELIFFRVKIHQEVAFCCAGKFYTLTTGANERRWEKMKDRLHTVVDSFKITV